MLSLVSGDAASSRWPATSRRFGRAAALALVAAAVLSGAAAPAAADDRHFRHEDRGDRDGRHDRGDWRGDIRRFHEHDVDRWRAGHWWRGRHDRRVGWWWIVGDVWYFYPSPVYPYPDPYQPPVVVVPAPAAPQPPAVYYYCENPQGYYPYVPQCFSGWRQIPAPPPG